MTESEEQGGKLASIIDAVCRVIINIVSAVREESRENLVLVVILIVLAALLAPMIIFCPSESFGDFRFLVYCLGGLLVLVVVAGVSMAFLVSFRERGKSPMPVETDDSELTREERGLLMMCIAAEQGKLKGTSSRHISKPIKVRQKALISTINKLLK